MIKLRKDWLLLALLLTTLGMRAQTTTTYTGTIKDLAQNPVTSGQVNFTLAPATDSTVPGVGRFTPFTVHCNINTDGTLSGYVAGVVSGACMVTRNTTLSPSGTSYRVCIQPQFATPGSCFFDYAVTASKDISTVAPTLSTGPLNYGGVPGPPAPPINFRGTWSSSTTYAANDAVLYSGAEYISLLDGNLNQNPVSAPAFWSIFAPGGGGSSQFSVMNYGGNKGGAVDNSAAVTAACAANGQVYFPVGTFNFTANYTVPCPSEYQVGAALSTPNGVAVTMNPAIRAYDYQQIFVTSGAGAFAGLSGAVPFEWFGVIGASTKASAGSGADYSVRAQKCLNSLTSGGWCLMQPLYYNFTTGLTITTSSVGIRGTQGRDSYNSGGADAHASGIVSTSALGTVLNVHGTSGTYIVWNTFKDFSIEHLTQPTGSTPTASAAMNVQYAGGMIGENLTFNDYLDGIHFNGAPAFSTGHWDNVACNNALLGVNSYVSGQVINCFDIDSENGVGMDTILLRNGVLGVFNSALCTAGVVSSAFNIHGQHINDVDLLYPASAGGTCYGVQIAYDGSAVSDSEADIHINQPILEADISSIKVSGLSNPLGQPSVNVDSGYFLSNTVNPKMIDCENSVGLSVTGNQFLTITGGAGFGLYANGCSGLIFTNNHANFNGDGATFVNLVGTSNYTIVGNNILNSDVRGGGRGYIFDSGSLVGDAVGNTCGANVTTCTSGTPVGTAPSFLAAGSTVGGVLIGAGALPLEAWLSQDGALPLRNYGSDSTNTATGSGITFASSTGFMNPVATYGTAPAIASSAAKTNFANSQPFTVAAWFSQPDVATTGGQIVGTRTTGPGWVLTAANGTALFGLVNTTTTNALLVQSSTTSMANNTLYHVCAVYDGTSLPSGVHIAINGLSQATIPIWNTLTSSSSSTNPVNVGGWGATAAIIGDLEIFANNTTSCAALYALGPNQARLP